MSFLSSSQATHMLEWPGSNRKPCSSCSTSPAAPPGSWTRVRRPREFWRPPLHVHNPLKALKRPGFSVKPAHHASRQSPTDGGFFKRVRIQKSTKRIGLADKRLGYIICQSWQLSCGRMGGSCSKTFYIKTDKDIYMYPKLLKTPSKITNKMFNAKVNTNARSLKKII
jgi:hypothetical protein